MLTLFSIPKPFRGPIAQIQRNAIQSWCLLRPCPEILVLGNEEGTAETCAEFGLKHVPWVKRNQHGTPLTRSVFEQGQSTSRNAIACYINADIILLNDFMRTVERCAELMEKRPFLLLGGRWNLRAVDRLVFERPDWATGLRLLAERDGVPDVRLAMDYFVFPKQICWNMPDFALGRSGWDSWFCYSARKQGIPVIDASRAITAIHQQHDYNHFYRGEISLLHTEESRRNLKLLGFGHRYTILDASHEFVADRLNKRKWQALYFLRERLREAEAWLVYLLRMAWPYSRPAFLMLRTTKRAFLLLSRSSHRVASSTGK